MKELVDKRERQRERERKREKERERERPVGVEKCIIGDQKHEGAC